MESSEINALLVDKDGVLVREKSVLPGAQEFLAEVRKQGMKSIVLSNTSRLTGPGVARQMRERFGIADFLDEEALTAVDVTLQYLREHPSRKRLEDVCIAVEGETDLRTAIREAGFSVVNDAWSNKWSSAPTDVVAGLDTSTNYEKLSRAWNAVRLGSRLIGVNSDRSYSSASGVELPAAGATLAYLATAKNDGKPDAILGKPQVGIGEVALQRMGLNRETARIAVIGDNLREDMGLACNLREAGWQAEGWMMLTGVTRKEQCDHPNIQRVFTDLRAVMRMLFTQ